MFSSLFCLIFLYKQLTCSTHTQKTQIVWKAFQFKTVSIIWKLKNIINFCNYAERKNRAYCIFSNVAKLVLCELLLTFWSNLVGSCSPWRSWSRSAAFQFSTALHEPLHFTQANFDKYCPEIMKSCLFVWFGVCALWPTHIYLYGGSCSNFVGSCSP